MEAEEYIFGSNYHNNGKWMHSLWFNSYISSKGRGTTGARGATAPLKLAKGGLSPPNSPLSLQSIALYRPDKTDLPT